MDNRELVNRFILQDTSLDTMSDSYLIDGFWEEVDEYNDALQEVEIGQSAIELAQEAADVLYYGSWIMMRGLLTKEVEDQVSDVLETLAIAGINYADAMAMKGHRNASKHIKPPYAMNGHSDKEHRRVNNLMWKLAEADNGFYHAYEKIGDVLYQQPRRILGNDVVVFDSARETTEEQAQ